MKTWGFILKYARWALVLGLFGLVSAKLDYQQLSALSQQLQWKLFFILIACVGANYSLLALAHWFSYRHEQVEVSYGEAWRWCQGVQMLNLILPGKSGNLWRLWKLKQLKMDWSQALWATLSPMLWGLVTMGSLSLAVLYFATLEDLPWKEMFELFFIALILVCSYLWLRKEVFRAGFVSMCLKITFVFALVWVLTLAKTALALTVLGGWPGWEKAFIWATIHLAVSLVPILPDNWGLKEWISLVLAARFGLTPEIVILVSLVERLAQYLWILGVAMAQGKRATLAEAQLALKNLAR